MWYNVMCRHNANVSPRVIGDVSGRVRSTVSVQSSVIESIILNITRCLCLMSTVRIIDQF